MSESTVTTLPPFPTLPSVARRFGRQLVVDTLTPVLLFLAFNNVAGLVPAMAAASAWSVALVLARWRGGRAVGPLVWFSLAYALIRGTAGIVSGSDTVYFGPAVATNFAIAFVFSVSVLIRRPLVGHIARIFYPFPDDVRRHDAYRRVFGRLTLAWAASLTFSAALQVLLLGRASTNTYVVVSSLAGWALSLALFWWSLRYPRLAFTREPDFAEHFASVPNP